MALFDPPKAGDYPKQWKDMSLEFKLMFVYHGCMMVLFITGGAFSTWQELLFTGVLLFLLTSFSIRHRRSAGWRWQGVKPKNLLMAAGGVALTGVFLYAATPLFPPSNPRFLPWFLAGLGIGTFNVLQGLRLVHPSEAAFLADCREPGSQIEQATNSAPTEPIEPKWHRVVRSTFSLLFFLVWLGFVAFFYYSGAAFRDGSPVPTPTRMDAVTEHGKTVYITHDQKILCDKLELFAFVGIPSVIVGGLLLHFIVGVKLYPNTPTLRELLARKSSGS
jgi:hypothetical protein